MTWKLKAISAAVAVVAAAAANAQTWENNNVATGSSLIFEAWTTTQSFTIDLGPVFNTVYGAAPVNNQAAGNTVYTLGSAFTGAFSSTTNLNWHVLSSKRNNDATSRQGHLVSSNFNTVYGGFSNTALNTVASNLTNGFSVIATNVTHPSEVSPSSDPAYTPSNTLVNLAALPTSVGGMAAVGFFSGAIDPYTSYSSALDGVSYFTAIIGNSAGGLANATRSAFGNANGSANWILQADGTLTYHVADAPAAVPLPAAAWLFGSGLIGLVGLSRRKQRAA